MTRVEDKTVELLEAPMIDWYAISAKLTNEERAEVSRLLDSKIEEAARLRGFIEALNHGARPAAVTASNNLAAKIRKALGFTYPRQDVRF